MSFRTWVEQSLSGHSIKFIGSKMHLQLFSKFRGTSLIVSELLNNCKIVSSSTKERKVTMRFLVKRVHQIDNYDALPRETHRFLALEI